MPQQTGDSPATRSYSIGYVLHGTNYFTDEIKRGAEDAGADLHVHVDVSAPGNFNSTEAIGLFEGMIQKGKDGIAVIPMPGAVWVHPIKEAADANIPVVTANITSDGSASSSWFGQDEFKSGVTLGTELQKMLKANGKTSGKILCGICAPGVDVLTARYNGLKKSLAGTPYNLTEPFNCGTEPSANYSQWESATSANPDTVAVVGLCSMDIPNLYKLKMKNKAVWLIAGYDLNKETLDAIKSGVCQISIAQHPYLQGYLPVLALARHLRYSTELPKGWVDVGTEVITKDNVDGIYSRETDNAAERKWYADYISKNYADLNAAAKPMPASK